MIRRLQVQFLALVLVVAAFSTGLPFLFYLDGDHGRGAVLYHRYDGHYGLIAAQGESTVAGPH